MTADRQLPTTSSEVMRPPAELSPRAAALWTSVVGEYELDPPSVEVLRQACRLLDRGDALAAAIAAKNSLVVKGSAGQPRPDPLLAEERQNAVALARLLRELGLDDSPMPDVRIPRGR